MYTAHVQKRVRNLLNIVYCACVELAVAPIFFTRFKILSLNYTFQYNPDNRSHLRRLTNGSVLPSTG